MPKPTSPGAALAALRKNHRGGRPFRPQPCPRCGAPCASAVLARAHCRVPRATIEAGEEVHSCDVSTHNDPPDCSGTLLDTGSAADKTIERLRSLAPKDLPDPIQYLAELNKEADS